MEQEEINYKTSSTGKLKGGREKNTTINQNVVTYNFFVTRSNSLSWK